MKTLFIHAKSNLDIGPVLKKVKLKGKIGLVSNIQHLHKLEEAKTFLKDSLIAGQVLGCDVRNAKAIEDKVDCFLYIGTGKFHPIGIALETKKPVYIANPLTNEFYKLNDEEIESYKKKLKGKQIKFLSSKNKGTLVSLKWGQNNLKRALEMPYPIFIFNTLNLYELENFPEIDVWINTACPRILDKNIINLKDLPKDK